MDNDQKPCNRTDLVYFEEALGQANADGQEWGVAMA
jgi:hypothetical protein